MEKEEIEKELCRMRIKMLQELKEDFNEKISPLSTKETEDLYIRLEDTINSLISEEAKGLI